MTFTLRLLGGVSLHGPTGTPAGRLSQPLAEAVLALLAVAGERGCTREHVLALLWPESDERHARHCLRNQLVLIRHALGEHAVFDAEASLHLDVAAVTSDVQGFLQRLAAGAPSEAVACYGGPFLDGFHLDAALPFQRWVDDERARLARLYAEALESLARTAAADGRTVDAIHWWRAAVAHEPDSTRLVVQLMRALARAGDRASALRLADGHARRLRSDLDVEPHPSLQQEVARIRRDGPDAARFE